MVLSRLRSPGSHSSQSQTGNTPFKPFKLKGVEQLSETDSVIAIMGCTGSGKSTFINLACGSPIIAASHGLLSCTTRVEAVRCPHPSDATKQLVLVDTPGFNDTYKSDPEILEMIAEWLMKSYGRQKRLTGIIYLYLISSARMTGSALKNMQMFTKLCGEEALSNVVLGTTMWSRDPTPDEVAREDDLRSPFWGPMIPQGSKMMRISRDNESVWTVVDYILANNLPRALLLQAEMVDLHRQLKNTKVGEWLNDPLRELKEIIDQLRQEGQISPNAPVSQKLSLELERIEKLLQEKSAALEKQVPLHRRFIEARLQFLPKVKLKR